MNIDRHNYEEYFILYMDNELSTDQRRTVESFVQQHPDLKEELELLQQFKLVPDTSLTFSGKEELMKINGTTPVTLANAEEWIILYNDNELTLSQRKDVEELVASNPSIQHEFSLLQKSKITPEKIVFIDKESLYRQEEKVRAIPIRWWRAAAAILILALGIAGFLLTNNKTEGTVPKDVAENSSDNKTIPTPQQTVPLPTQKIAVTDKIKNTELVTQDIITQKNKEVPKTKASKNSLPTTLPLQAPQQESVIAEVKNKPSNNLSQPENNTYQQSKNENNVIAKTDIKEKVKTNTIVSDPVTIKSPDPSDIHTAALTNQDPVDENSGKKNKLRGFFRKVTRTLEKRTNIEASDDDEKLLVGGLAIRLK